MLSADCRKLAILLSRDFFHKCRTRRKLLMAYSVQNMILEKEPTTRVDSRDPTRRYIGLENTDILTHMTDLVISSDAACTECSTGHLGLFKSRGFSVCTPPFVLATALANEQRYKKPQRSPPTEDTNADTLPEAVVGGLEESGTRDTRRDCCFCSV